MRKAWIPPFLVLTLLPLTTCSHTPPAQKAYAKIMNSEGKDAGTVLIQQVNEGVKFHLYIQGLPQGTYGFAVHEFGECDPPDFINAGRAFPTDKSHGTAPEPLAPVPTLGEVHVKTEDGVTQQEALSKLVTLGSGDNSLFHPGGTSFLLYSIPPDGQGPTSGGKRVACGVIFQSMSDEDIPQTVPEGELEDANTPRNMDIPGEIHRQPKS